MAKKAKTAKKPRTVKRICRSKMTISLEDFSKKILRPRMLQLAADIRADAMILHH